MTSHFVILVNLIIWLIILVNLIIGLSIWSIDRSIWSKSKWSKLWKWSRVKMINSQNGQNQNGQNEIYQNHNDYPSKWSIDRSKLSIDSIVLATLMKRNATVRNTSLWDLVKKWGLTWKIGYNGHIHRVDGHWLTCGKRQWTHIHTVMR